MQLISLILFIGALASLIGAIFFVEQWHNTTHRSHVVQMLREGIDLIGISAIVEYPSTPAPLIALLEEESGWRLDSPTYATYNPKEQ